MCAKITVFPIVSAPTVCVMQDMHHRTWLRVLRVRRIHTKQQQQTLGALDASTASTQTRWQQLQRLCVSHARLANTHQWKWMVWDATNVRVESSRCLLVLVVKTVQKEVTLMPKVLLHARCALQEKVQGT